MRCALAWQPLFGSGMRINWGETLGLDLVEVEELLERIEEWREEEHRRVFGGH